jgi:serpin B
MANRAPFGRPRVALLVLLLGSRCMGAEPPAGDAAKSGAAFGADLYRLLAARQGNVFFSPYSISEALALLSAGASGKTQQEMLQALHWTQPSGGMAAAFAAQDLELDRPAQDGSVLSVANGLWYQAGGPPLDAFRDVAQKQYRARVQPVDFIGSSAAVRPEINEWVEKKTLGKIADLFPEGTITRDTRLVLANAIYFKGRWKKRFDEGDTAARPFFTDRESSVQAPTMETSAHLRMAAADDLGLLELPYEGGDLSMVILLPGTRDGLAALEQRLGPDSLALWLASLDSARIRNVQVRLPRFKLAYAAELTKPLQQLGMTAAFSPGAADFSGIDGRRDLRVSAILHKACVEVNEEGTVAAAATGVTMEAFAVEMSERFFVDHPFLFLIRDTRTGSLLFLGRVADPTRS